MSTTEVHTDNRVTTIRDGCIFTCARGTVRDATVVSQMKHKASLSMTCKATISKFGDAGKG